MQQTPSTIEMLLPFVALFAIFYFMIIRPQSKKMKSQEQFNSQLKRGDEIITSSGLVGVVDALTEQLVTLEIANNVKIKILRKQIIGTAAQILNNTTPQSADNKSGKKG